jgi:hypothetical protein
MTLCLASIVNNNYVTDNIYHSVFTLWGHCFHYYIVFSTFCTTSVSPLPLGFKRYDQSALLSAGFYVTDNNNVHH